MTLPLSSSTRRALERMARDLRRVLDTRLVALVATGSASSVVFAEPLLTGDLDACGALAETWHREGLETPLFLTPDEFHRSLDAFPLEYQAILDRHEVIAGAPPFAGAAVDVRHLRHACEVQARGHLIHVRQGWIDASAHQEALADLLARSATPLRLLLSNVGRLSGHAAAEDAAVAGARAAGLPDALVRDILALEADPENAHRLVPRLAEYVAAAEQLWAFVDTWQ